MLTEEELPHIVAYSLHAFNMKSHAVQFRHVRDKIDTHVELTLWRILRFVVYLFHSSKSDTYY